MWRRAVAEGLGTFFLTLVAAGLEIVDVLYPGRIDRTVKAAGPALIVGALIYAIGDLSGAHLNPVVTTTFALRRVFHWSCVPVYWAAQLAGALAAAGTLRYLFGTTRSIGVNETDLTTSHAVVVEVVLTALLVIVILNAAHKHSLIGADAAIPVAATLAACGLVGGELTSASMNPARSLGPAIVSANYTDIGVFIAGPFIGALVAVLVMTALHPVPNRDEQTSAEGE